MKKALATLALAALTIAATQAQVVYSTNFNTPTYGDGGLIGQDSWAITGTSVVSPINVSNTATNGIVSFVTTGQDVNRVFSGGVTATPANASSIQLDADINLSAAQTGDYFIHLGDGTTSNFFDRVYAKAGSVAGTFDLGLGTSSGGVIVYGADLNFGTTYTISALYNFVAGATNDTAQLSVNGVFYVAGVTTGTDAVLISSVNIRQGTAAAMPTGTIDNIFVTVTPAIPEPATWMLIGVGLLVGGMKRFRRTS